MNKSKAVKKFMELLGSGKYAEKIAQETTEAAKKTWKPGELVRTIEPPRVPDVDPKFAEEYLENLRRKASLNPTPENIKRFQEAELDLVGKLESKPRSVEEQEALRRLEEFTQPKEKKPSVLTKEEMRKKRELDKTKTDISTEKKPVDVLQETLETRVKENPTPENIEVLENFRKKRAAGEYPDLSRGLKVAGLAGAIGTGMSLAPEEAEAGALRLLSRKEVAAAMKAATREGKPDITALFKSLGAIGTSDEHLIRGSNILDHLIFEKTGLPETRAMDAVQTAYPEFKKLKKIGETKKPDLYGRIIIPESEIGGTLRRDPLSAKLLINPELKTRIGESALLAHEAQHLRDAINTPSIQSLAHPKTIEDEIKNVREILNAFPEKKEAARQQIKQSFKRDPLKNQENLSFDDVNDLYLLGKKTGNKIIPTLLDPIEFPQVMTHRHHVEYPKNYEWEKTKELIEEGIRPVNEDELFKKMQEVSSDYRAASKKSRGSVAGLMATAGVGAGTLAAPLAQASEGPTVLQSNPEFSNKETIKTNSSLKPGFISNLLSGLETVDKLKKEGKLRPDVGEYIYENLDKYVMHPAKRAALGALKGEKIPEDQAPQYSDIYKQAMENVGKQRLGNFLKTFSAGAADDPSGVMQESIQSVKDEDFADAIAEAAGVVSDVAEDPLAPLTLGAGRLSKAGRFLSKIPK